LPRPVLPTGELGYRGVRGAEASLCKRTLIVNSEIVLLNYRFFVLKVADRIIKSQTKLLWNFESVAAKSDSPRRRRPSTTSARRLVVVRRVVVRNEEAKGRPPHAHPPPRR
jgi:hypothetical protein